jgi:hypothetical protein
MTQALYAHMNNKRKKKEVKFGQERVETDQIKCHTSPT